MPGRGSDPASTNGSKRAAADETLEDNSTSSRTSKRLRRSANTASLADADALENDEPKKRTKRVTAKGTAVGSNTSTDVKVEQEGSSLVKAQTTRVTEDTGDAVKISVKKEFKIEEEIQPKKATKKRTSKEEKAAEMAPLAARTKGLQMFIGAHVSAAKGSSTREITFTELLN
jgi:AP endonuclease-1